MVVCISVESVVVSPLSFFIASVWLVSLFFFINLASDLFCWSFQKKTAPGFIDFLRDILCLYLLQFCFDISYFLYSASFWVFWFCSSSSFNFDDRVSILDLSLLLMSAFSAINFPLDTALNVFQRFWYVVSSSRWFPWTSLFLSSFHCLSSWHSGESCPVSIRLCGSELIS